MSNVESQFLSFNKCPFIYVLKLLGIDLCINLKSSLVWTRIIFFITVIIYLLILVFMFFAFPCAVSTTDFYPFLYTIFPVIVNGLMAIPCYICMYVRQQRLKALISNLVLFLMLDDANGRRRSTKVSQMVNYGLLSFLVVVVIIQHVCFYFIFHQLQFSNSFQNYIRCLNYTVPFNILLTVSFQMYPLYIDGFLILSMGTFVYICFLLSLCGRNYYKLIDRLKSKRIETWTLFQQYHAKLCSFVRDANEIYSVFLFWWFGVAISICCWIRALHNPFFLEYSVFIGHVVIIILIYMTCLFAVIIAGGSVNQMVMKCCIMNLFWHMNFI